MNNLAKLTIDHHRSAERNRFAKYLISGNITPHEYATYLYNVYLQYNALELLAENHELLDTKLANKIYSDFMKIKDKNHLYSVFDASRKYIWYLKTIENDPEKIMAHVYVRHMGDLSGGQIIAKKVPGEASMYNFDDRVEQIKSQIRSRCSDSMADEANRCFEFVTSFFTECADEFNLA